MSATISTETAQSVLARDARFVADAIKIRYFPFALDHGDGGYLFDVDGRRYLDFGASWALAGLGYSNERVREAIKRQVDRSTFGGLLSGANVPAADLAERLVSIVPGDFEKKVWFGLSGSDAAEAAARLILKATGRRRFVSFVGSWHGTHDGTMALSAHPSLNEIIGGANVIKIPYPNPYRNPFGDDTPGNLTDRCLDYLENYLFKQIYPAEDVAAVFAEAVQADGGDIVPPPDFIPKLRALCDRHGILLVMDEIKIGMGRTGRMFGYEHGGVAADVVLLGKSLGGGMPLSAIVARKEVLDVGSGTAVFTASGNATSCAAGLAVIEEIEVEGLVERSAENGVYLGQILDEALGRHEIVGDRRNLGMIAGVELVTGRASKEPNPSAAAKVVYRAWELGLIVYYAGMWGNALEITPPLILSKSELEQGVAILDQAIEDVLAGKVSDEAVAQFAGW
jgi:4-aminobutyrate aminotransferase